MEDTPAAGRDVSIRQYGSITDHEASSTDSRQGAQFGNWDPLVGKRAGNCGSVLISLTLWHSERERRAWKAETVVRLYVLIQTQS